MLAIFRLKGQPKREGSIIVRSSKASQSSVYPIRDAFAVVECGGWCFHPWGASEDSTLARTKVVAHDQSSTHNTPLCSAIRLQRVAMLLNTARPAGLIWEMWV